MRRAGVLAWLPLCLSLTLAACGGGQQQAPAEPTDPGLESSWRLARFALQNGQTDQAVTLYRRVLARAYARDDAAAIGNVGYEYALALLRDGQPRPAATQAIRTRAELERRAAAPFAELFLVEAVAYYEAGDADRAGTAADEAIRRARPDDQATPARAHFVLGMLAADAGDAPSAERELAAMGAPANEALIADRAELRGRGLMLAGDAAAAIAEFETAATLRRDRRDYTGMARALAAAGAAARTAGDAAVAADLYYRAGSSAAVQDDVANAEAWLNEALQLAERNGLDGIAADARDRLQSLAR